MQFAAARKAVTGAHQHTNCVAVGRIQEVGIRDSEIRFAVAIKISGCAGALATW
jgi:hypothetical protein